jgi:NADPH:quinone reductase-like Zn-dependent oxidoreductase
MGVSEERKSSVKAIQIEAFGNPAEVVKAVDVPDVGAPATGEVVIALEASPINQYDLLMIAGGYGYRPRLPAIMGTEGAGRVVAVGAGVKHLIVLMRGCPQRTANNSQLRRNIHGQD